MKALIGLALLLAGCGQQSIATCTQSLASASTNPTLVGTLEAEPDARLGSAADGLSCVAVVTQAGNSRALYTARHCLKPGSLKNFVFRRMVNGQPTAEPIRFIHAALIESIKNDRQITDPELQARLRSILDGGGEIDASRDEFAKRCLRKTPDTACFTALDLVAFRLDGRPLGTDLTSQQVDSLEAYSAFYLSREVSLFEKNLMRCERKDQVCPDSYTGQGRSVWNRYFASTDWEGMRAPAFAQARNGLKAVWQTLDARPADLTLAKGQDSGLTEVPLTTPVEHFEDQRPHSRTFMMTGPSAFARGDSGTLLLSQGIPVAVLSALDGEPSSGGASVIALPKRESHGIPAADSSPSSTAPPAPKSKESASACQ